MGYQIQQANTATPIRFLMVLGSDHITGATGLTPTVTIAKNNGGYAAPFGAVTEVGNGFYQIEANAVDANTLGPLLLHATAATADPTDDQYDVVNYNPTSFSPNTAPTGPSSVSALALITDAFELIGIYDVGEVDTAKALRRLNQLIDQWSLMALTIPYSARDVFPLVAGQGSPTNPYTVGINANLNIARPVAVTAAGLLLRGYSVEVPLSILTEGAYRAIAIKTVTSTQPTALYYEPTYASGWGSVYLYPVPTSVNDLVLYHGAQLSGFASLSAPYDLPPGAADALTYQLARRLARPYGRQWSPDLAKDADDYLGIYKRTNTQMVDLGFDAALTQGSNGRWNILSDGR